MCQHESPRRKGDETSPALQLREFVLASGSSFLFEFLEGKDVSSQQEKARYLLPQAPIERWVSLCQSYRHVATGKTNQCRKLHPAFLVEINIDQGRIVEELAHGKFFFARMHDQVSNTSR